MASLVVNHCWFQHTAKQQSLWEVMLRIFGGLPGPQEGLSLRRWVNESLESFQRPSLTLSLSKGLRTLPSSFLYFLSKTFYIKSTWCTCGPFASAHVCEYTSKLKHINFKRCYIKEHRTFSSLCSGCWFLLCGYNHFLVRHFVNPFKISFIFHYMSLSL